MPESERVSRRTVPAQERRVPVAMRVTPGTNDSLDTLAGYYGTSRGGVVDRAVAALRGSVGEEAIATQQLAVLDRRLRAYEVIFRYVGDQDSVEKIRAAIG